MFYRSVKSFFAAVPTVIARTYPGFAGKWYDTLDPRWEMFH